MLPLPDGEEIQPTITHMPVIINRANVDPKSFTYQPPAASAEVLGAVDKELQALAKWIAPNGNIKPGTLRLMKNWDGTMELKRRQWYQFWNFMGNRDTGRAKAYVNSLIKYAANNKGIDKNAPFANYLEPTSSSAVTTEELQKKLFPVTSLAINLPVTEREYDPVLNGLKHVVYHYYLEASLNSVGITLGKYIGAGACGDVYHASIANDQGKYVFKTEKNIRLSPISDRQGLRFDQRGDLAASLVPKLKNMTKPIFVVVALAKEKNGSLEHHYLPAGEAKTFVEDIAKGYPSAQVGIAGQLMELASGKELLDVIKNRTDFAPDKPAFQQVAYGLCQYMESAMDNNYSHCDIKPENMMVHKNVEGNYEVKVIDGGFAAHGESQALALNTSKGTPLYMSPRVALANELHRSIGSTYGPETDFYSIGMVFLAMIDPESFCEANKTLSDSSEILPSFRSVLKTEFIDQISTKSVYDASKHLETYISFTLPNSKLAQALHDPKNKDVKNLIDLSFQVSAGGEKGQAAYREWKTAFAAWEAKLQGEGVVPPPMQTGVQGARNEITKF